MKFEKKEGINMKKILLLTLLTTILTGCNPNHPTYNSRALKGLNNTEVVTDTAVDIKDKNIIYCTTFQLAWNELKNTVIKDNIKLNNEPSIVKILNKESFQKKDLAQQDYVAQAGFVRDGIVDKIDKELETKFGNLPPFAIVSYAFLLKELYFKKNFQSFEFSFFNGSHSTDVKAFGIKKDSEESFYKEMQDQVVIKDYRDWNDYIIQLSSKDKKEEIILARVRPSKTLGGTLQAVQERVKNGKEEYLIKGDSLKIPEINFDVSKEYKELYGKNILNKGFEGYEIVKAIQDIKFSLNKEGAKLKSEALIITLGLEEAGPKRLSFDQPFLLYMKQAGSEKPYLVLWIANPEILVKL